MTQTSMRGCAIALASMGFRVFKLGVFSKIPAVENWPSVATSDVDQVRQMWTCPIDGEGLDNNIGILTGAAGGDLMVLDVDRKNGAQGDRSLGYLVDSLELDTRTFTVRTPSGGSHLYLRTKPGEEVRNSVSSRTLGVGLDVRGHHGFVVGPGSETALGVYSVALEAPIASAPGWLVGQAGRPRQWAPGAPLMAVKGLTLDAQAALERAAKWLVEDAPCAVEGCGGDATTFDVALHLGDLGVSMPMALELMLEWWNTDKALPAWPVEDLERKVRNAYQYRRRALGVASPEVEFDAVKLDHPDPLGAKPAKGGRFRLIPFEQIVLPIDDEYLVEGLISRRAMALLWAKPGAGKSALMLDLALCVATGRPWHGRVVERGAVVYVAAEAADDTVKRKVAWEKVFLAEGEAGRGPPPFYLIDDSEGDITKDAKRLGDDIAIMLEQAGQAAGSLRLIVIDTMAATLAGSISEDNLAKPYLKALAALRRRFGCATLVLHHCGWNDIRFMGSSTIMANLDIELKLTRKDHSHDLTLSVGKARSDDIGKLVMYWRTETVPLPPTQKGTPREAYVVRPVSTAEKDFEPISLTEQEAQLARLFLDFRNEDKIALWADIEPHALLEWKENKRTQARTQAHPSAGISKVRLRALRISLERKGIIEKMEQGQWLVKINEL